MNPPASWEEELHRLPHGPEFRFLDKVLNLDPGRSGAGEYRIRGDEPFLRGHFPGQPIFPGVLLLEAGAQLAGLVAQSDPGIKPLRDLKLTAVRHAKITGAAEPGAVLRIEASVVGRLGNLIQASARVVLREKLILTAEFTLSGDE